MLLPAVPSCCRWRFRHFPYFQHSNHNKEPRFHMNGPDKEAYSNTESPFFRRGFVNNYYKYLINSSEFELVSDLDSVDISRYELISRERIYIVAYIKSSVEASVDPVVIKLIL